MTKGLTIILRSGAMSNMDPNVATRLAKAALKKGYNVHLFCYGEGITAIKAGQGPKRFPNTGKEIEELIEKGLKVAVCKTCSSARGIQEGEEIKGAKIGSLTSDLSAFLSESDRVITLAR